jgi:hypothetical protein
MTEDCVMLIWYTEIVQVVGGWIPPAGLLSNTVPERAFFFFSQ